MGILPKTNLRKCQHPLDGAPGTAGDLFRHGDAGLEGGKRVPDFYQIGFFHVAAECFRGEGVAAFVFTLPGKPVQDPDLGPDDELVFFRTADLPDNT